MFKKIFSLLMVTAIFFASVGCGKNSKSSIYDNDQNVIVSVADVAATTDESKAYLDIAVEEATEIIAALEGVDVSSKKINLKNYNIYTYYDPQLTKAIADAYSATVKGADFGCAITSLNGNLLAAYSASNDNAQNFATTKKQQHSAMKPLSVYAPAIESGLINWSTQIEDSPYKQIENSGGQPYSWPANANGRYSLENTSIYQAVKQSLNTVAVKVLAEYGVDKSIDFLQTKLGIDLSAEQYRATIYDGEEVLGNIALGATQAGSSPVEMAGYYQMFANGGYYCKPTAIKKITTKDGTTIYENKSMATQVISSETSYIMNELLRGVITAGGTGSEAFVEDVQIAGKTGTGDNFIDNWFVGVTPEYSCAVWHSNVNDSNLASKTFAKITEKANVEIPAFMTSPNVKKVIYCDDSGLMLGQSCTKAELGYFDASKVPEVCTAH